MAHRSTPTIKGMFVNGHIEALRKAKGAEAVQELERRFGGPIFFGSLEDVPVRDEIAIIEHSLDLTSDHGLVGAARARAAGRLHYTNFSNTTFGSVLLASLPRTPQSFGTLLKNSGSIARSVFKNTEFRCEERYKALGVIMQNSDYSTSHFEGFFEEWMRSFGVANPRVSARIKEGRVHEYILYYQ